MRSVPSRGSRLDGIAPGTGRALQARALPSAEPLASTFPRSGLAGTQTGVLPTRNESMHCHPQRLSDQLLDPRFLLDLKLKICECDMSLQTVESEGSRRKKEKEDREDLRSENCSIDMIRVEEDQLVLLELGP